MDFLIPTCGESPYLVPLIEELRKSDATGLISIALNNMDLAYARVLGVRCGEAGAECHLMGSNVNIYRTWNLGVQWGRDRGCHVGVLNDDVWLDHRTILPMSQILDGMNRAVAGWDYVHTDMHEPIRVQHVQGTYRRGGIGGFAFAVDPKLVEPIDERFQWWGGDDDLVYTTRRNSHQVVLATGLGVKHWSSTSSQARPIPAEVIEADRRLMLDKWGESW